MDVLIQGFPGKAVCHGGLGWSTVSLLRGAGRVILLDVGAFGVRRELNVSPRVRRIAGDEEFLPGLQAIRTPGHTPGHLIFLLTANDVPVLFTGDAAKNRAELLSGAVDASEGHAESGESLKVVWRTWRAIHGTVPVPGHDLSMRLDAAGQPEYIGERRAAIAAWFSERIETTTRIDLCCEAGFGPAYR